jgi:hypothetical protein
MDFTPHSRAVCTVCANRYLCACVECKTKLRSCGMDKPIFPMLNHCNWNTILNCPNFKHE